MRSFASDLLRWYDEYGRELPFRATKNPYFIWISEVILQQTQVVQGWDYYLRFIERFPTVKDLAAASEDEVLKLWQGLGYYTRARNLHAAAQTIMTKFNGQFPENYADIRSLKGVGDYTAAAVASIAFNLPHPAIDGNVLRVIARIFGIRIPVNTNEGLKEIKTMLSQVFDVQHPGEFNQAIMDFGAIQCVPKNPKCEDCIFQNRCQAYQNDSVKELPAKIAPVKVQKRALHYVLARYQNQILLHKRTAQDIWKGLHDFPLKDTFSHHELQQLPFHYRHKLTHRDLEISFFECRLSEKITLENCFWIEIKDFKHYAVPKIIAQFATDYPLTSHDYHQ